MKVVSIVGARPQFIKCAPVSRVLRARATEVLVHTGQHYDDNMSEVFFRQLAIPRPDHNLAVGSGAHGSQTARMLEGIEAIVQQERPDWVLVYGDTNSTLAGALAAAKLHVPVAHVEAGLRSFNRRMPEEINRVLTDHVSALLFCPTPVAVDNLAREGISRGVHLVGDVMYEALLYNARIAEKNSRVLADLRVQPAKYFLATIHRAENTDDPGRLGAIVRALREISREYRVLWPVHPRTRHILARGDGLPAADHLTLLEPLSYLDMLQLEKHARGILTDSGGVQKEACWLEVPCVTLRDETEWLETVESGWNVLVGADTQRIVQAARRVGRGALPPPGRDDQAATRIVAMLA